jgi:hypothetical protein
MVVPLGGPGCPVTLVGVVGPVSWQATCWDASPLGASLLAWRAIVLVTPPGLLALDRRLQQHRPRGRRSRHLSLLRRLRNVGYNYGIVSRTWRPSPSGL